MEHRSKFVIAIEKCATIKSQAAQIRSKMSPNTKTIEKLTLVLRLAKITDQLLELELLLPPIKFSSILTELLSLLTQ